MKTIPGINIQWPWSELLLSGKKTIETRTYPLPKKYIGVELAVIETPGPRGKKEAGIDRARVVGTITFGEPFRYATEQQWRQDRERHLVEPSDGQFSWDKREKLVWGWTVLKYRRLKQPANAPNKRGIVFATKCRLDC